MLLVDLQAGGYDSAQTILLINVFPINKSGSEQIPFGHPKELAYQPTFLLNRAVGITAAHKPLPQKCLSLNK